MSASISLESLNKATRDLLDYASSEIGKFNAWTSQTKVFVKVRGYKGKLKVFNKQDVNLIKNFILKNPVLHTRNVDENSLPDIYEQNILGKKARHQGAWQYVPPPPPPTTLMAMVLATILL